MTNEVEITSEAIVGGQKRIAKDLVYREADQFAMFAVGDFTINGNSTGAAIGAAGGDPLQLTAVNQIDFGVGPNGTLTCTGGTAGDTTWIGEDGATVSCGNNEQETTTLSPLDPSFCTGDEVSTAFHPCVDTGAQSTDSCPNCVTTGSPGSTYCPLPGIGFKTQPTVSGAPKPPSNAVFDCTSATPGGAVFIGDTTGTSPANAACASATGKIKTVTTPTVTMPDDFTTLPAGNYYLDSNNVSFCGIPPTVLPNGPVNIFILPQGCGTSGQCAFDTPTQANYTCPVGGSTSPQMTVDGYVNVTDPPTGYTGPTLATADDTVEAGLPSDFGIFWGGDSSINFLKTMVLDSNFYAPGAQLTLDGSSYTTIGSLVLNCFSMKGGPTMDFTYAQHPAQYLQGWTSSQYSITP